MKIKGYYNSIFELLWMFLDTTPKLINDMFLKLLLLKRKIFKKFKVYLNKSQFKSYGIQFSRQKWGLRSCRKWKIYRQKRGRTRKLQNCCLTRQKGGLVISRILPFMTWQGLLERYLSSANQVIPDWFKITFLVGLRLQLSLGLMTWGLA